MSEKASEKSEMSSVGEARMLVRRIAEPREVGDSVKAAIVRSAWRLGFRFGRTKELWYGHARRIDAREMDRLRERAASAQRDADVARLRALHHRLAATDASFYRAEIAALDDLLRRMGAGDGALAVRTDQD